MFWCLDLSLKKTVGFGWVLEVLLMSFGDLVFGVSWGYYGQCIFDVFFSLMAFEVELRLSLTC